MATMVTTAMVDAIPPRACTVPLELTLPTPGAHLALAEQHRISAAVGRVMSARVDQLERGHSFAKDMAQDERFTLRRARQLIDGAMDHTAFKSGSREAAIRYAAQGAALLLAFLEIQLERSAQEAADNEDMI